MQVLLSGDGQGICTISKQFPTNPSPKHWYHLWKLQGRWRNEDGVAANQVACSGTLDHLFVLEDGEENSTQEYMQSRFFAGRMADMHASSHDDHNTRLYESLNNAYLAAGQLEEMQRRLAESHAQAQTMQEVLEVRLRGRTQSAAKAEEDLRVKLTAFER